MNVSRFTVNPLGVNCYVLWDAESREAIIVDPGFSDPKETDALDAFIVREHLRPIRLINTHQHFDHILGNGYVSRKYSLPVEANEADDFLGKALPAQARAFGVPVNAEGHGADANLRDGDRIYLGAEPIEILAVPGHSPGSIALYAPQSGFVITGDALFRGSIGRTDLAGGDHPTLINAIRDKLFTLPDDTAVLPGHGPESTIGFEKQSNPYF